MPYMLTQSQSSPSVPVFFGELGEDPSSGRVVALFVVIFPHQVQHRDVVRLCHDVLLQIWLQICRLDLHDIQIITSRHAVVNNICSQATTLQEPMQLAVYQIH